MNDVAELQKVISNKSADQIDSSKSNGNIETRKYLFYIQIFKLRKQS